MIAKNLFKLLNDDYNLVFLIKQICNRNRLAYYVSVALMWAALYRFTQPDNETKMFRMHKICDLTLLLESIDLKAIEKKLVEIHRFLTLISVFQNLIILRKPRYEEYICFKSFFKVSENDLNIINFWLEKLKHEVETIGSKEHDQEDCMPFKIIELLDLDILNFMKQALRNQELEIYSV